MISLAQLHSRLGNDLRPAAGGTVAVRQISGVHISELDDPTPYLEGGELLLTTGIPVSGGAAKVQAYVRRLVERDIAALGLGLGAGVDEVPPALSAACAEAGLELLVVPDGTPFMNVSRAYWDLVGREGQADLAASLGTQTALARAATMPDALPSVVKALARALGGWVAYLPADGGAETLWPEENHAIVGQLRRETSRLDMAVTHSASTFQIHGTDVVEYPVLVGRRTVGFLAIGAGRKLTRADRQVIMTVCVLLSLKAAQQQESDATAAALGSAVTKLLLTGHVDAGRALAPDLGLVVPTGAVRLLVVHGGPEDTAASAGTDDGLESLLRAGTGWPEAGGALRSCRLRHAAGGLSYYLLDAEYRDAGTPVSGDGNAPPGPYDGGEAGNPMLTAVLSRPMPLERVHDEAGQLAAMARALPAGQVVSAPEGALDPRAQGWVAALQGYRRADLVGTVRAYLRHRGQWEGAARELGIHRNSLRHRMGIATELLQADPDDPDVAASLWLALRWV
ncbi:PucR family transcriptional regulator [Arthrobacter sp. PM3]|uniref:PucR family transcriptional regulator n=1 Tax=Arthrobacter sp. PM3 TaxID=2017685 RepID=UPI000E101ECB|nr:PucR family transcriptional regulator [Arthrobacter sp. PM3]AXJ09159.1 PucR family transcriptional regulator [Arthrobacter sp. PM3]